MIDLYLHIGSTKTGSTALQSYLTHNKEALSEQGTLYPETLLDGVAHHKIATVLNSDDNTIQEAFKELHSEISESGATSVILSTETMFFLQDQKIVLQEMLAQYNVHPIVYLRRQDIWFEAMYTQTIKHEQYRFNGSIREKRFLDMYDHYMNYDSILSSWKEVFPNQLKVGVYETHPKRLDVIQDFFKNIPQIDTSTFKKPEYERSANKSLTYSAIRYLRAANTFSVTDSVHAKIVDTLTDYSLAVEEKNSSYSFLSEFERKQLLKRYQSSNMSIAETYGIGLPTTLFSHEDIGSSIIPPVDSIDINSLARVNFMLGMEDTSNPTNNLGSESNISSWLSSGFKNFNFIVDSKYEGNKLFDDIASTSNLLLNVLYQDKFRGNGDSREVLRKTNEFLYNEQNGHKSDFFKSLSTLADYTIEAIDQCSSAHNGCTYVTSNTDSIFECSPINVQNENHIITSIRFLDHSAQECAQSIYAESNYSEYIHNHLTNNKLKKSGLTLSCEVLGIGNKKANELTSSWANRVQWLSVKHPEVEHHLSIEQALDVCFTMAVIDSGLHVNQII